MKKINMLGLTVLGCGALLLTGCGGDGGSSAHSLKCSASENGQSVELEFNFNDDETKLEKVSMSIVMEVPEGTSDEEVESTVSLLKSQCQTDEGKALDKCDVKLSGKKLTVTQVGAADKMGYDGTKTKEDIKSTTEAAGYSCK